MDDKDAGHKNSDTHLVYIPDFHNHTEARKFQTNQIKGSVAYKGAYSLDGDEVAWRQQGKEW